MAHTTQSTILDDIILSIPSWKDRHYKQSDVYQQVAQTARKEVGLLFGEIEGKEKTIGPIGLLNFPYCKLGAIDSLDLFGLDELIIFSFYKQNQKRYKKTLDLGANIGLHSLIMGKLGFSVNAYEPDPKHYQLLVNNLKRNQVTNVTVHQAAVSTESGKASFTRVLGNTTSSHLTGAKNPYGELEQFEVEIVDIKTILKDVDFVKMDVEGHEIEILRSLEKKHFETIDWMLEISTEENKVKMYELLQTLKINAFSQKCGWGKVKSLDDLPATHREGSLFLTNKEEMPW